MDELFKEKEAQAQKMKTTEGIGIRAGRSSRTIALVDGRGNKTPAGRYWEQISKESLPEGGFLQQTASREGNTETIKLRDGGRGITRRWDTAGEWKFTALGKAYYRTLRRNYVVQVPVVIKGSRKDGATYSRKSHMPMTKMGLKPVQVPLHLTLEQRRAYVKREIEKQMKKTTKPIYEASDEAWWFDDDGSWAVNEETVGVDPDTGKGEAHAILDRRVRGAPLGTTGLPFADCICEEAYAEAQDNLCAPRQMARILKLDVGCICEGLSEISQKLYGTEHWEEQGCTPRMVLEYCKKYNLGCICMHNEQIIEQIPGNSPIMAFAVLADHVYFYEGKGARKALSKWKPGELPAKLRKAQKQVNTPDANEWKMWSDGGGEPEAGHFWCFEEDIAKVRAELLQSGLNPKVLMKDEARIRSLILNLRKKKGTMVIHAMPEDFIQIEAWLKRLDIGLPYRGEGLPSVSLKVLQTLIKKSRERVWLTGEEKAKLLEEYNYRCAQCGSRGELEWDHVARLSDSHGEQEFQPLCVECHREKTTHEARMYDDDQLASHFELEVWKQYVESERPPALVARLREVNGISGMEIADVIRCRRSALLYNAHPFPVFCPLDDIQRRVEPTLGDINFVAKQVSRKTNVASNLGYTGPGWQHRVQTEWLLHTGIITWEDVTHVLTATAHLPAGIMAEPLRKMEEAWLGDEVLAKFSINSLIGLWAIDAASNLKIRTSTMEADAPAGALVSTFHYGEKGMVYDFMTRTELITNASCRPLHDLCMCTEAVRVGQMLLALRSAGAVPYELKTDSVLYQPKKRRRVELDQLRFRDLDTLYTKSEPRARRPPVQIQAICSEDFPFRKAAARENDLMKMDPQPPQRRVWLTLAQRCWNTVNAEEGERRALAGQGLMVMGIAGTGKTTFCKGIVERLQAQGEVVHVISKTHVASKRAGGVTADHWVRRHVVNGTPTCNVLWIDEISQLDCGLLLQLCKLTFTSNFRFIISGDFNQFQPIGNNFRGTPVEEGRVERSNLLHTMAGGNVVTLTECKRSGAELFDYYSSLIPGGSRFEQPLFEVLREAKAKFTYEGFCPSNLVISHRKRIVLNERLNKELNEKLNKQLACKDALRLEITGRTYRGNAAQTMLIWPGIQLMGSVPSEKRGVRNGCIYTVEAIGEDSVKLAELEAPLTFLQAKQWLRLSYAQTYASVQGTEFEGAVRLHDVGHKHFTLRHLFVGLSRAKDVKLVSVVE